MASLAPGMPCVISPIAAEGMDLPAALAACVGVGVGVDAAELAAAILRLHDDEAAYGRAALARPDWIGHGFDQAGVAEALHAAIEGRKQLTVLMG